MIDQEWAEGRRGRRSKKMVTKEGECQSNIKH